MSWVRVERVWLVLSHHKAWGDNLKKKVVQQVQHLLSVIGKLNTPSGKCARGHDWFPNNYCNVTQCCFIYFMACLCHDRSEGWGVGGFVLHSVKALIISALLVLVAWLRWKANTGSPPLLSRTLSIQRGSVPGLNAGGPFSWKWLGHCGVSGALTIWRHIYKAFTCLTKAQTELRPKTPLFTCSFFFFTNIPFERPPPHTHL